MAEILYLPQGKVRQLCRAIWDGAPLAEACAQAGMSPGAARTALWRLHRRVEAEEGRAVSREYVYRRLFAPDAARVGERG